MILNFILASLIFPYVSWSQVTADDYKRADDLSKVTSDKVYYGNVRPIWIGSTGSFLYEINTPDTYGKMRLARIKFRIIIFFFIINAFNWKYPVINF